MRPVRSTGKPRPWRLALLATAALAMAAPLAGAGAAAAGGQHGTLLLIGGAILDDNRPVYRRFLELAAAHGPAHVVIVTAASAEQDESAGYKIDALHTWDPALEIQVVRRETPTAQTVAAIDRATALYFTGGDQARITARYRPGDADTPEWLAMRRLLARDGVIAGTSAGDAMMGEVMFLSGGSTAALGIVLAPPAKAPANEEADEDKDDPAKLGPKVAPGMRFLPWAIADSHFFQRDRLGRLVAALESSGRHLGIGVGEDAAVEVDLAHGELRGVSVAESLLVDTAGLRREGLDRLGLVGRLIGQGDRIRAQHWLAHTKPASVEATGPVRDLPPAAADDDRILVSWRLFRLATAGHEIVRQRTPGYSITAWPANAGNVTFEIRATN
jgi:cyanophycinase